MGVAAPRSGSPESTTFWGGRRAEAQRRMAEGGFLESRGMTEGQGKKVADPPLRLDDRGAAVPGQIRPVKRSQSVACWRTWEMATGLQTSGREIMRVKSVSVRRFCVLDDIVEAQTEHRHLHRGLAAKLDDPERLLSGALMG